jgi:hypothetical protein
MKNLVLTAWLVINLAHFAVAQKDTIIIEGKGSRKVVVLEPHESSSVVFKDTNSIVSIEVDSEPANTKKVEWSLPSGKVKIDKKDNYSINFLSDFSFGYATVDNLQSLIPSPNSIPLLNDGFNFSMNILKQEVNLLKHQIYLTTAIGINNYYFSLRNERLVPNLNLQSSFFPTYNYGFDSVNNYQTNRIDSRFLSVPIMFKWTPKTNQKNGKVGIAAGVELNFRNRVFAKLKINENQREQVSKFNLGVKNNGILTSYIVRAQYGSLGVFGRMTVGSVIPGVNHIENNFTFGLATKF